MLREPGFGARLATAGLVVATTLGAVFAVLIAGSFGPLAFRLVYLGLAAAALVPWLVVAAFAPGWLPSSRLMPAIAACLAAFAVSTATSSQSRLSLEMLAYAVLLAELYLFLVALMRRPRLRASFGRLAIVLATVVCVVYGIQVALAWMEWWDLVGRLTLPPLRPAYSGFNVGSPNPLAALVLVLVPFALASLDIGARAARVAATILVLLAVTAVLMTGSRGAWFGAAAALVAAGVVAAVFVPRARDRFARLARSRSGLAMLLSSAALLSGALLVAARSGRLTIADAGRDAFNVVSQRMFESAPLVGIGPGTWQVLREGFTAPGEYDAHVPHAHSLYWQALAEFGLLSVVAGFVVAVSIGVLVLRALRSGDSARRGVAIAVLFGTVLLAVQQVVDMFMNVPPILLALALPLAWLDAVAPDDEGAPWVERLRHAVPLVVRQRAIPLGMAVITSAIVVGLFRVESVTVVQVGAVGAANSGSWTDAADLAREAADADPELPHTS